MSWYQTDGFENEIEKPAPRNTTRRFWIPVDADKETKITFLDDTTERYVMTDPESGKDVRVQLPVMLKEHQLRLNGHWRNWFTCLAPQGKPCPVCQSGDTARQIAAFTVIDHSRWKDKQGNWHQDEVKLWVVKTSSSTFKLIQKQAAKRKGLRGCVFTVSRLGDKSSGVGDNYEYEEKVDEAQLVDSDGNSLQPYNYLEVFKPKSGKELSAIVGGKAQEDEEAVDY